MKSGDHGVFHDIQEFEEITANFALTSNLLQVNKGMPTIRHDYIDLGDLMLRRLQVSHTLIDGFRIRDGWTTFVFTPALEANALWNGVQGLPDAFGIVRSGMDHEVLMPAGWSTIEVDVADHLIDSEDLLPERVFADAMAPEKGQLRLNTQAASALKRNLLALFDPVVPPTNDLLVRDPALDLRRRVLDLLAAAAELGCRDTPPGPVSSVYHYRLVRQARALFDSPEQTNLTVESVALELGVTTRSLQRCFRTVLGVSPKQYSLACKLNRARRILRRRGQATSVVDIAHEFGFISASRFAEQFKRQFGHPPSTVNRLFGRFVRHPAGTRR